MKIWDLYWRTYLDAKNSVVDKSPILEFKIVNKRISERPIAQHINEILCLKDFAIIDTLIHA